MFRKYGLIVMGLIMIISACKRSLKPSEYYKWNNNENNTVSVWKKEKHYNFNVIFRPKEFMALAQLNGEKLTNRAFKKALSGFECCRHFAIKIYAKDTTDVLKYKLRSQEEYFERIKYLSSEIGNHLKLVEGNDTLSCTFAHYERTFKMQPHATVMAFFERKNPNKSESTPMKLILSRGGFNPTALIFDFTEKQLKTIPNLNY